MPTVFNEIGYTGLEVNSGQIEEETLHELRGDKWVRALKSMLNDPVIGATLFAIEMLARQTDWQMVAADDSKVSAENADFFRESLFSDMSHSWADTLSEILSFLPWGWSYFETVYKQRADGRIGWRKWSIRSQDSLARWEFDKEGGIAGMVQWSRNYQEHLIPIEKSLLFRASVYKGNPEGRSIMRTAYRPYAFKTRIENLEGIGIERDLAGLPVANVPAAMMQSDAEPGTKLLLASIQKLLNNIRKDETQGVIFPRAYDQHGHSLFELQLLSTGGARQFDTGGIVSRYDQRILMAVMADFLMLGSGKTGSFALSSDKTDLFTTALSAWLDSICGVINRHAIPRLGELNGMKPETLPKLEHGEIKRIDLAALGAYVSQLSGAQIFFDDEQQEWLKRQAKMPVSQKS